jgi:hypothetical protein
VASHPLKVGRTLYFVTKSSVAFAAESAGFDGSDIAEGGGEMIVLVDS